MPIVGDIITGLVMYAHGATVRAVGPIKSITGGRFFAQLRAPINGAAYNSYFNIADEYVTWAPGDQVDQSNGPLAPSKVTLVVDGIHTGTVQLAGRPVTGLVSYQTQAWVRSVGRWFDLVDNTGSPPKALVLIDTNDGRQWASRNLPNQQFLAATYWSVSPLTGSDEAAGWGMTEAEADDHPLRTYHELNRRLYGWNQDNTCEGMPNVALSIHNLDAVNTEDTFAILTNLVSPNYQKYVRIRGTLNPVDENAVGREITGYVPADPISNTEREIIIAGLGLAPQYVGMIVQTVDGQRTGIVTRQNAADRLAINEIRDGAASIDGSGSTNVADFAIHDRVSFLDPTQLADWPFPPYLQFPLLAQTRLDLGTSALFPDGHMGSSWPFISQCLLGSGVPNRQEFLLSGGVAASIMSSGIFATHANAFQSGYAIWTSCAILINGDGPFIGDYALVLADENTFVPYGGGGVGLRVFGDSPCTITLYDSSTIASFGMGSAVFDLMSTHGGQPGSFTGNDTGGTRTRWYGKDNTGYLLIVGKNGRCKFPKLGASAITSAPYAINIAGKGPGDTNPAHNKNFGDIPIVITVDSLTVLADSTPDSF